MTVPPSSEPGCLHLHVPYDGPPLVAEPSGQFIGPDDDPQRYELFSRQRFGTEGVVWQARRRGHADGRAAFAIKVFAPVPGAETDPLPPGDLRRWQDQLGRFDAVSSPHLPGLRDVFVAADTRKPAGPRFHLVTDWIDGPSLDDRIRSGNDSTLDRLGHVRDLAAAYQALHVAGAGHPDPLIRHDIKPTSAVVHPGRGAVLVDVGRLHPGPDGFLPSRWQRSLFVAPELHAAPFGPRSPESDLYSLGALAFFCVTGYAPAQDMAAIRHELAEALTGPGIDSPGELAAHLAAMLEPDPEQRPPDPLAWADHALALATDRPRGWWARMFGGPVSPS
ncbi:hypothetical protein [Actinoplanes couchii]|uniref:non-specific serine/threonine protein kinase n=1 Tax=Actinoplanes couchii TaxID=403638 RepID=A0ABQ3XKP1_9ACTN|nr:hypothetical protein [Actinoplanes couchii]MDR6319557.1 serine/threonine protein kinase [Actinoplanes couchii]GID59053.1 hypothetical protein Aco03nite_074570 [Actinoplanes couchii]